MPHHRERFHDFRGSDQNSRPPSLPQNAVEEMMIFMYKGWVMNGEDEGWSTSQLVVDEWLSKVVNDMSNS